MSKRLFCLTLLVLITAGSSGCNCICCLHDNLLALYKSRRWKDCGCGPVYMGPWIDSPPNCCDPCDGAGNFTGRRYWESANMGTGIPVGGPAAGGGAPMMGGGAPMMDDSMDGMEYHGEAIGPGNQSPTPAAPQMRPQMNQPTPAAPPSSYPAPRMGRRQTGMAMGRPSPYDNNYSYPAAAGYNYNY